MDKRRSRFERASYVASGAMLCLYNLAFVCLLVLLARSNRFCADDFSMLGRANMQGGTLATTSWFWTHWSCRWFAVTMATAVAEMVRGSGNVFWYSVATFAAFIGALWALIHATLTRRARVPTPPLFELNVAILVTSLLFFISPERGEVWFWLCGAACYLWPFTFLFVAGSLLQSPSRSPVVGIGAAALVVLATGCNESLGALVVLSLGAGIGLRLLRDRESMRLNPICQRIAVMFACGLAALIIEYFAPGNLIRMTHEHAKGPFKGMFAAIKLTARETPMVYVIYAEKSAIWMALTVIAGIAIGRELRLTSPALSVGKAVAILAWTIGVLIAATILCLFMPAIAGSVAPLRSWVPITVLFVGALLVVGVVVSARFTVTRVFEPIALGVGLMLVVYGIVRQAPIVESYADRFDVRYSTLTQERDRGRTADMVVPPLNTREEVAWIDTDDLLNGDRNNKWNVRYRRALRLRFDVIQPVDSPESRQLAEPISPGLP